MDKMINYSHPDYKNEILNIMKSNLTPILVRQKLHGYHENDIASAMEDMNKDERTRLYSILETETVAEVLEYADDDDRVAYLNELPIKKRAKVLDDFDSSDSAAYLNTLEKAQRIAIIELMDNDSKRAIAFAASFDEDEIGSKMTDNYIAIMDGIDVREAMRSLVNQAADNDNISTLYVIDKNETLLGSIDLKDLIIARESTSLENITITSYPYVYANELIEDCIERIKDYCEDSIPVLDEYNRLRGILTASDVTEMVKSELGEDYAKLAGLSNEEDVEEPLKMSIKKRIPWLFVLLGLGLVVSTVVGLFEHVVEHLALIVSFQSLVLDMAGNVGTQSLAVTIRVLMDEEVSKKQKNALVRKEARVGLTNGMILGTLSFVFIGLYLFLFKGQAAVAAFSISACTGVAMLIAMFVSSLVGTTVPILFKALKIDPAVASGPLITTMNDLVAVITYYGLAWGLLINVLHM